MDLDLRRRAIDAQHLVIVEVGLHHAAILEADFPREGQAQPLDHRALKLGLDPLGIDHRAAIKRDIDARNADRAFRVDLHLDGDAGIGHEAAMGGDAQPLALRQLAAPADALGGGLDHLAQPGRFIGIALGVLAIDPPIGKIGGIDHAVLAEQLQQIVLVVAPGRGRQFGDEALDGEGMRDVRDRAEPADPGVGGGLGVLDLEIGDIEWIVDRPHAEFDRDLMLGIGHEQRAERGRHRAMQPGDRLALGIQTGLDALDRNGVQEAVMQIVLAGEADLDRLAAHFLGEDSRLLDVVRLGFAAEPAAQQQIVQHNLLQRHVEMLGQILARHLRRLGAAPHLDAVRAHLGGTGGRLHRRLGEMGNVVVGVDPLRRLGHRRLDVAILADHLARCARRFLHHLAIGRGVVRPVRAVIPLDGQFGAALDGGVGGLGHHRDAAERQEAGRRGNAVDRDHFQDAGYFQRLGGIISLHLAEIDRRPRHHGEHHALGAGIDAVDRLALGNIGAIDQPGPRLADIAELGGILELQLGAGRHGTRRGGLSQFAIAERAARGCMQHLVVLRLHLRGRHVPARGGFSLQHLAGSGADAAQRHEMMAHRARAVGVLAAEALLVARRLQYLEQGKIGLQLIGHHHGEAGAHSLPHFGAVALHRHGAVLGNGHKDSRIVLEAAGHGLGAIFLLRLGGQGEGPAGQHQAAGGEAEQQGAAADIERRADGSDGVHGHTPPPAACLMAARIRG